MIVSQLNGTLTAPLLALLALPPTLALAYLSWRFVEAPALRRVRRRWVGSIAARVPFRAAIARVYFR